MYVREQSGISVSKFTMDSQELHTVINQQIQSDTDLGPPKRVDKPVAAQVAEPKKEKDLPKLEKTPSEHSDIPKITNNEKAKGGRKPGSDGR